MVRIFVNDGSWSYDPKTDGKNMALAECKAFYRNTETTMRVAYAPGRLQVALQVPPSQDWILCAQLSVTLPGRGYFGVSAATGGLSGKYFKRVISSLTFLFFGKIIMIFSLL